MKSTRKRPVIEWVADCVAGGIALAALIAVTCSSEPFSLTMNTFREANPCPSIKNTWRAQDSSVPCPGYLIVAIQPRNHREWGFKWEPEKKPKGR